MYHYLCSQSNELSKKPRKNPDITKQRDRESMVRYNCKGRIKILINETEHVAYAVVNTINNEEDVEIDKKPSFDEYIQIIESTSKILKEQKDAENIEWLKKVERNFRPLKR
jgi:hypothetical protein